MIPDLSCSKPAFAAFPAAQYQGVNSRSYFAPSICPRQSSSLSSLKTMSRRAHCGASSSISMTTASASRDILALDFDGVLCDTVGESSISGIRAMERVWPDLPNMPSTSSPPSWLVSAVSAVRPVIETGFEIVLLARALFECGEASAADKYVSNILSGDWPDTRDKLMDEWGVGRDELVKAFGDVRDDWIARDLHGWLATNTMFTGVADALNDAAEDIFIITTKEARFAKLLLESAGVKGISEDRIYGLGSGTKISVLKKILAMPESEGRKVIFVEDRYETLEAVSISMLGQPLQLLLASWGYNTQKTRDTAEFHPFITAVELSEFVSRLQAVKA